MKSKFKLERDLNEWGRLTMHPLTANRLGIINKDKWSVVFGIRAFLVEVHISPKLSEERLLLSIDVIQFLSIPLFCSYEIVLEGKELVLGPFIGIVAEHWEDGMKRRLKPDITGDLSLTQFTQDYQEVGGAIVAFSEEGVDPKEKMIMGYMFNPETKCWVKGEYSYPAALFAKVRVNRELADHLHSKLGKERIFNTPVFDKWAMHLLLASSRKLRTYLPATILYEQPGDIEMALDVYGPIYIKPVTGENGIGVQKVTKQGGRIFVHYRKHDRNREVRMRTSAEVHAYFGSILQPGRFILQKALELFSVENRIIDYRFIVVKSQDGQWIDMGLYARHGQLDSVISNMNAGATPLAGEVALREFFRMTENETYEFRKRLSLIGMNIAHKLDEHTVQCGNLGIDIGVDRFKQIWIIEVNQVDPGHAIVEQVGYKQIHRQIRLANMLFAKRLSGFKG
mgnify:FL=1